MFSEMKGNRLFLAPCVSTEKIFLPCENELKMREQFGHPPGDIEMT
jgi:hypothetical protein